MLRKPTKAANDFRGMENRGTRTRNRSGTYLGTANLFTESVLTALFCSPQTSPTDTWLLTRKEQCRTMTDIPDIDGRISADATVFQHTSLIPLNPACNIEDAHLLLNVRWGHELHGQHGRQIEGRARPRNPTRVRQADARGGTNTCPR